MNNKQLDMVLGYLNEGIEINKEEFLNETENQTDEREINFFGTKTKIKIKKSYEHDKINNQLLNKVDGVLKTICNAALWDYLYKINSNYFENEINDDPYFDGKTIKSGKDLRNSIEINNKNTAIFISEKHNAIFFCGEYWPDPEHGFSVAFPKGNFVKNPQLSQVWKDYYDEHYHPKYTVLGEWQGHM